MVTAQQVGVQRIVTPGQTAVQPGQISVTPYAPYATTTAGQLDISTLLASIMPLIMLMMVFMMITPMMKSMGEAFKSG